MMLLTLVVAAGAPAQEALLPLAEPADAAAGAWQLELEIPVALATRRSAAGARGEVDGLAGVRAGVGYALGAWSLSGELGLLLGIPARTGSPVLAVTSQDSTLDLGLRFGREFRARGFAWQPYLRAAALAGVHLGVLELGSARVLAPTPVWGGAAAVGLRAGHGAWFLRWDLGGQLTTRTTQAVASVGLGRRW